MHAVQIEEFGIDIVQVRDLPDPFPGIGEVLIATEAATINPADLAVVTGVVASRLPFGAVPPFTPGWDLVGRVIGCGPGVDGKLVGRRVLGFSLWFDSTRGTHTSAVALPIGNVVPVQDGVPSTQLTTVGLNGLTAWRGLADLKLKDGETVVITGATGGVGGFAVQLAASRGFKVIGVVRGGDGRQVLALGADAVVSTADGDVGAQVRKVAPQGADALLDTASLAGTALAAVRDGGKYVTVTTVPATERGIDVFRSGGRMDAEALSTLARMATTGQLDTPVAGIFEIGDARRAYEALRDHTGRGRIILAFPEIKSS